jgi:catalase
VIQKPLPNIDLELSRHAANHHSIEAPSRKPAPADEL